MSASERRVLVGIYHEQFQAEMALQEFRELGFRDDQLEIVMYEGGVPAYGILDDLAEMGMPDEEIGSYKREFEAGRTIVIVRCDRPVQDVFSLLFGSGHVKIRIANTSVSSQGELENQVEATPNSSSNISLEGEDAMASLRKLLKDAGLDHLL